MRDECRNCGAKRKEGIEWYDDDYCSGKCKVGDGGTIPPASVRSKIEGKVASLTDYLLDWPKNLGQKDGRGQRIKGRHPKMYRRRHDPERLNWGTPLEPKQLKQAGLRANRKPIPGDFDYVEEGRSATEVATVAKNFKVQTGENMSDVAKEEKNE
jgi:hypothetical protein